MNYCFMDFEFTCNGKIVKKGDTIIFRRKYPIQKSELISVGLVIMNSNFKIIKRYYQTVKPSHNPNLSEYCMLLTRLTQNDIDISPNAFCVIGEIIDILRKYRINSVYSYGNSDVLFLKSTCFWVKKSGLNPKNIYVLISYMKDVSQDMKEKFKLKQVLGLSKLCRILSLGNESDFHNALYDAEMLGTIYRAIYCEKCKEHQKYLAYLKSEQ